MISKPRAAALLLGSIVFAAHVALAQTPSGQATKTMPAQHVSANTGDLKWGPAPPGLPPGGQVAVVDGDPGKAGPFIMAVKLPAGYKVPPHWHPTDENVVVTSGSLLMGVGD
jgi:quercetin dioxygenase-like cupin family protein